MELPKALKNFIKDRIRRVQARSCTVYVQDPWFPNEPRLVLMPGVKHPEPMHGFLFPAAARRAVLQGPPIKILTRKSPTQEVDAENEGSLKNLIAKEKLYGGFATRECVGTSIRLIKRTNRQEQLIIFINFDKEFISISGPLRSELQEFLRELSSFFLPPILFVLRREDPLPLKNVLRILQSAEEHLDVSVEGNLRRILGWAKEIVSPLNGQAVGSVHIFDNHTRVLKLIGVEGDVAPERLESWKEIKIDEGGRLLSWVALRRAEILVSDLQKSEFARLEASPVGDVRSILAVPVLGSRERLVGVLNVESKVPNAFSSLCLRALWCIANLGAAVYRPAEMMQELLHIGTEAQERLSVRRPLDDLAELMKNHQRAEMCFIWGADPIKGFIALGTSHGELEESALPRSKGEGWSHYIFKMVQPVLISSMRRKDEFAVNIWNSTKGCWQLESKQGMPKSVHDLAIKHNICEQLGMPIMDQHKCLGVIWLKYNHVNLAPRTSSAMTFLFGFASEIAMVLISLYRQEELQLRSANDGMKTLIRSLQHDVVGQISSKLYREIDELPLDSGGNVVKFPTSKCAEWKWLLNMQREMVSHLRSVAEGLTGQIVPTKVRFNLSDAVSKAFELVELVQKDPPCRNKVPPSLMISADRIQILLILANLIRNAKKFTPFAKMKEEIILSAENITSEGQNGICITVEDGGCGFPKALVEKVYSEHGPSVVGQHAAAGSGTGLFLCSQFIRAHNGTICKPETNYRGGTTIRFFVPQT